MLFWLSYNVYFETAICKTSRVCLYSVHSVRFFFIISDVIKKWYLKMIVRTVITDSPDTRPEDPCLQDR